LWVVLLKHTPLVVFGQFIKVASSIVTTTAQQPLYYISLSHSHLLLPLILHSIIGGTRQKEEKEDQPSFVDGSRSWSY
jgi:hypothetical protein